MINAPAAAGDYVDYASVQFFRTKRAAEQVARGNPLRPDTVYHSGDAPVMRDDREEIGGEQSAFTPDPADLYTPSGTETGTETATEPLPGTGSASDTGTPPDPATGTSDPTDATGTASATGTAGTGQGCRSAAGACIALILPVCAALPALRRRRTR